MDYCSPMEKRSHSYRWKINNYYMRNIGNRRDFESPEFEVHIDGWNTKWCLLLKALPGPTNERLVLQRCDDNEPETIFVSFDVSSLDGNGYVKSLSSQVNWKCSKNSRHYIYDLSASHDSMDKPLHFKENSLTLICHMWTIFSSMNPLTECTAVTHIQRKKIEIEKVYTRMFDFCRSQIMDFSPENGNEDITIYRNDDSRKLSFCISLNELSDFYSENLSGRLRGHFALNVLDFGGVLQHFTYEHCCVIECDLPPRWCFDEVIDLEKLEEKAVSPEYALTFQFHFTYDTGIVYSSIIETKSVLPRESIHITTTPMSTSDSLPRDLRAIYMDRKFTDVQLEVDGETLFAHKAILCARSPVFAAMFNNEMTEKTSGIIHITDINIVTLDKLLLFMYAGIVDDLDEEIAMTLLSAADKYQVMPLKEKCSSYLKSIISTQNVCHILRFADFYHEEDLKSAAEEFICLKHCSIFSSDVWRHFIGDCGILASEIFLKLSAKYSRLDIQKTFVH